jgi:hypothetical protein
MRREISGHDLSERVQAILDPGESLLWVGQPQSKRFWSEVAAVMAFGLLLLGAGTGLLVLAWGERIYFLLALGLALAALGCFCLLAPWRLRHRLRQATYALTDRRAVVFRGVGWSQQDMVPNLSKPWYSFGPRELCQRALKHRYGRRMDLVFGTETQRLGRGKAMTVDIGFMGLEDPDLVEELLEQWFPRLVTTQGY